MKRLLVGQTIEITRLSKLGYSLAAISGILGVGKSTVYYHAKNSCRKMSKIDLTLLNALEKGYIVGLFLGDGSFNKGTKNHRFFVRFALDLKRDKDIALRLIKIFNKATKKICIIPHKSNIIAKTCSKELVAYLDRYVKYTDGNKTLIDIQKESSEFKYGLIGGLIDSDGHVHRHLGTEIRTVSDQIAREIISILEKQLGMPVNVKMREASVYSYSKKRKIDIYIPSAQMRPNVNKIPSVKISRYLNARIFAEKD